MNNLEWRGPSSRSKRIFQVYRRVSEEILAQKTGKCKVVALLCVSNYCFWHIISRCHLLMVLKNESHCNSPALFPHEVNQPIQDQNSQISHYSAATWKWVDNQLTSQERGWLVKLKELCWKLDNVSLNCWAMLAKKNENERRKRLPLIAPKCILDLKLPLDWLKNCAKN